MAESDHNGVTGTIDTMKAMETMLALLPEETQATLQDVFDGKASPALYSDVIAKGILNPDVHPDRLNFLLRRIVNDDTIDVDKSAGNEMFKRSIYAKTMISDIPAWLKDGRLSDVEMQKVAQEFIFTRTELYASDMLLLQYSVEEGQAKAEMNYTRVKEAVVVVLMVDSPQVFKDFESDRYIHRFIDRVADSGLRYTPKAKTVYVQLDKCLEQFRNGINGEEDDRLQIMLSMIANADDERVVAAIKDDEMLVGMRDEAYLMGQDKEVQFMLTKEKYDQMDWLSYGNEREEKGANQQMVSDAQGMYAEGIAPDVIARIQKTTVAAVKKMLGLQEA